MKRTLIACAVIACAGGLAIAASPEVDKAIKTIQSATADPAKLKLFCGVADEDDDDDATDAKADAKEEKDDPAEEKQAADALKQLGGWRRGRVGRRREARGGLPRRRGVCDCHGGDHGQVRRVDSGP